MNPQRKWITALVLLSLIGGVALASGSGPAVRFAAPDWQPDATYVARYNSFIQPGDAGGRYYFAYHAGTTGQSPPTWCDTNIGCSTLDDGGVNWYNWSPNRTVYTPGGFQCLFSIPSLQDAGNSLTLQRSVWSTVPIGTTLNLLADTSSTVIGSVVTACTDCLVTMTGVMPIAPATDTIHYLKVVAQVVDGGPSSGIDTTSFEVDYIASDGGRDTCTTVTLTFDDTFDDEYNNTMFILLDAGMTATFYVNPPRYHQLIRGGSPQHFHPGDGYMTKAMVKGLVEQGMDTSEHTLNHHHLDCLDLPTQQDEVLNSRTLLLMDGIPVHSTAFPFGGDSTVTYQVLLQGHQQSGRDIGGIYNGDGLCGSTPSCLACPKGETIPPKSAVDIRAWRSLSNTCTAYDPEKMVMNAEDAGGGWIIVNNHHLCPTVPCGVPGALDYDAGAVPANNLSFDIPNYLAFASWLKTRGNIGTKIRTMREVMGGAIFPPSPIDGGPSFIKNSHLENFSANGELGKSCAVDPPLPIPDCFIQDITGDAQYQLDAGAAYFQSTIAYDGTYAGRYAVDYQSTGISRIVTNQSHPATDLYYCPPLPMVQRPTSLSIWYKANDPPIMSVFSCETTVDAGYPPYIDDAGHGFCGWQWFYQTPLLAATGASEDAGWLNAVAILRPEQMPVDSQYGSFGMSLLAVVDGGDHFQIVDNFQFSQMCPMGVDAGNSPTNAGLEDWTSGGFDAGVPDCATVLQPPECFEQDNSSGAAPRTYSDAGAYWTRSTISHTGKYSMRMDFDSLNSGNIKFLTQEIIKPPTFTPYCPPMNFDPTKGFKTCYWRQSTSSIPMDVYLWRSAVDAGITVDGGYVSGQWLLRKQTSSFAATGSLPFIDDAGVGFVHDCYSEDGGEPADATAISFGPLTIQDGGSMLIDDLCFTQLDGGGC